MRYGSFLTKTVNFLRAMTVAYISGIQLITQEVLLTLVQRSNK